MALCIIIDRISIGETEEEGGDSVVNTSTPQAADTRQEMGKESRVNLPVASTFILA